MKEEEGRRNAAMDAFHVAEKSIQELKRKLQEEEKERKYAVASLESAKKQAESQRLLMRTAEDSLASSKTQIATLKKKLEEVDKARGLAEKAREEVEKAAEAQGSPPRAPPVANTSSVGGEQAEDTTKAGDANQGIVQGTDLAPIVQGDFLKEKETSQSMELVLATLAIPPKVDPKDKAQVPPTAADTQPPKDVKEKLVIKMKK